MASQNIDIIINAQDKTKEAFSKVESSMSGFKSKVQDMQPAFQKMAGVGTVAFAAIAGVAVSALKESAGAAADMANANQTLSNTLDNLTEKQRIASGGSADLSTSLLNVQEKMKVVSDAALKLGFDDESASQSFAKLFQVTKDTAEANRELQIAMDLARDKGISLEEATQKLVMVHAGATKELKAQGIAIDENATAMENMASLEDNLAGKALAFANTTAGAMAVMQESMNNAKQAIGDALAPAFTKLLESAQPLIDKFTAWATANPELLAKIIMITGAVTALVAAVGFLGVALAIILSPMTLVALAIAALVAWVIYCITQFDKWKKNAVDTFNLIKTVIKDMADSAMSYLQPVLDFINKILDGIEKAANFVGEKLGIGGGKKKKVNDAVINPSGDIVETHPKDWVIATQNPSALFGGAGGGGITINMNGGTYLDQGVASDIGDMILEKLQFNMRGA